MSNDTMAAAPEQPQGVAGTQLLTLDPVTYVTAVFAPFRERFEAAKAAAAAVTAIDCTTTDGMKLAIRHRAALREIRVEAEKARQGRKKPILDIGRLLDTRAKELEAEITPLEDRFDSAIKAEETRKEDERIARERAEQERVERIHARVKEIRDTIIDAVGRPAGAIAEACASLREMAITKDVFFEFAEAAEVAKRETLAKLDEMHAAQVRAEAEAARLKAEREELDRRQAEQAQHERQERDRAAAAEAERQRLAAIRADIDHLKGEPVRLIGKSSVVIGAVLADLRSETFGHYAELADEARAAHATVLQQIDSMLADAQSRERMKAEEERIAAEAKALEERQRADRLAQEERERQERLAAERRERDERLAREQQEREEREAREREEREARAKAEAEERARADVERRAQEERSQAEQRARDEAERVVRLAKLEIADITEALAKLRDRVTELKEFTWFARAYDTEEKKRAKRQIGGYQPVASGVGTPNPPPARL